MFKTVKGDKGFQKNGSTTGKEKRGGQSGAEENAAGDKKVVTEGSFNFEKTWLRKKNKKQKNPKIGRGKDSGSFQGVRPRIGRGRRVVEGELVEGAVPRFEKRTTCASELRQKGRREKNPLTVRGRLSRKTVLINREQRMKPQKRLKTTDYVQGHT